MTFYSYRAWGLGSLRLRKGSITDKGNLKWKFLVSLETQVIMMFCWYGQMKECFAGADTVERMSCKHIKGCMVFGKNINMTPQTVGA